MSWVYREYSFNVEFLFDRLCAALKDVADKAEHFNRESLRLDIQYLCYAENKKTFEVHRLQNDRHRSVLKNKVRAQIKCFEREPLYAGAIEVFLDETMLFRVYPGYDGCECFMRVEGKRMFSDEVSHLAVQKFLQADKAGAA
jgi:hypothetical protein